MQPWHENPQWVAIVVTAAVSILSLAFTLSTIGLSRRTRRAVLEQSLIKQRNDINEAFARYTVRGPFATVLGIPDDELKQFIPRTHLLFLQLNLLEDVYQNRQLLQYKRLTIHEGWAKNILAPWINSDPNLIKVVKHIYQTNDIMDPGFIIWLKTLIPIKSTG
jgi:hypothetical protein